MTLLGSAAGLDRQGNRREDADYLARLSAHPGARFMPLLSGSPLLRSAPPRLWFSAQELRADAGLVATIFLGTAPAGDGYFALNLSDGEAAALRDRHALEPPTDFRTLASTGVLTPGDIALAALARSLFAWHESARHCGWCGAASAVTAGGWKRHCTPCAKDTFPRLDPVVIMLVHDGEHCILAHEPRYPERMFSAIAGYIEPGEDIAHAVARETFEELGLAVREIAYHASQPWPFPHSLMIGCMAKTSRAPFVIDHTEIVEARWFARDEARQMLTRSHPEGLWVPGSQAIAHHLIRAFVDGV